MLRRHTRAAQAHADTAKKTHSTHSLAMQNPSVCLTARNQTVCQASNQAVQVRDAWGVTGAAAEAEDLCGDRGHQGLGVGVLSHKADRHVSTHTQSLCIAEKWKDAGCMTDKGMPHQGERGVPAEAESKVSVAMLAIGTWLFGVRDRKPVDASTRTVLKT